MRNQKCDVTEQPHTNNMAGNSSESSSGDEKQTSASKKQLVSDQSRNESKPKKNIQQFHQAYYKTWPRINPSSKETTSHFASYVEQTFQLAMGAQVKTYY